MNICRFLGATAAAVALTVSSALALDVLHIASSNDTSYQTYIEARYEGAVPPTE